jgi:RNA polymerase sigma factor (sigma-70 family)
VPGQRKQELIASNYQTSVPIVLLTDHQMIHGCINKDEQCQRLLFERYAGKMLTVCLRYATDRMEAEDILQDAFVKVYKNITQFKFEGSFEGWVRKIVVNTALKYCQKKKIRFDEVKPDTTSDGVLEPSAYSHISETELLQMIHNLPEGYKVVFNLHIIEGYSHEEIARILNIKDSTSRSQLVKARRFLQNEILKLQKSIAV